MILLFIFILAAAAIPLIFYDSSNRIETEEITVTLEGLSAAFDGFRIVHLSDQHGREFGRGNEKLLSIVRSLTPDIIVITGDIIDDARQTSMLPALLGGLVSVAPTYYVNGNHEYAATGLGTLCEMIEGLGVTVLLNRWTDIERSGQFIRLLGIQDPNGPADIQPLGALVAAARAAPPSKPFIVAISHRYERFGEYAALSLPLTFVGHAHGGLVRLPFTDGLIGPGREWFPQYTSGLYELAGAQMITSRGLGSNTDAPRFLNPPHVVLAILETKGD